MPERSPKSEAKKPRSTELVEQHFKPEKVSDNAGMERWVYKIPSARGLQRSLSFQGRYELPILPTLNTAATTFIGAVPLEGIFQQGEFDAYLQQVNRISVPNPESIHYQTTRDFEGFVHALGLIAPDNPEIKRANIDLIRVREGGQYSQASLDLMEKIIACQLIDDNGQVAETIDPHAEMLILLSLLVDIDDSREAREIVNTKVAILRAMDVKTNKQQLSEDQEFLRNSRYTKETVDINSLTLVRICPVPPEKVANGDLIFPVSPYVSSEANHALVVGASVHWTLNSIKTDTSGGDWSHYPMAVVAPLGENFNPKPTVLTSGDTYWKLYPTERLIVHRGILVEPVEEGRDLEQKLFVYDAERRVVYYKRQGLTMENLKDLVSSDPTYQQERSRYDIESYALKRDLQILASHVAKNVFDFDVPIVDYNQQLILTTLLERVFSSDRSGLLETVLTDELRQHCETAGVPTLWGRTDKWEQVETPVAMEDLIAMITRSVGIRLTTYFRDHAIREAINLVGGKFHQVSDQNITAREIWIGNEGMRQEKALAAFAIANGMSIDNHRTSFDTAVRSYFGEQMRKAGNKNTRYTFDWRIYDADISPEKLVNADPRMRAQVYASGILNARVFKPKPLPINYSPWYTPQEDE